ncbi:MAG: endonuclease MutS2, partial [Acidobacteriota bacterium]
MKHSGDDLLEFAALKQLLGRYVSSAMGRAGLEKVAPASDRARLEEDLAEVAEAMEYLSAAAKPQAASRGAALRLRFDMLPDIGEAVGRLRIQGAILVGRQIHELTEVF